QVDDQAGITLLVLDLGHRRDLLAVRSDLRAETVAAGRRRPAPAHVVGLDEVGAEPVGGADEDPVGLRLDARDVPRLPVERGPVQPQPASLTDREPVRAPVLPNDLTAPLVDDLALVLAEPLGQPAAGVTVGDEADVVAVGLLGHGEAALRRLGPD